MSFNGFTTTGLLRGLRDANPGQHITEAIVRWQLRIGRVPAPQRHGGAFIWTIEQVRALCDALALKLPEEVDDVR